MRIIDTGITKEILTGCNFPQLKIGDNLYTVDNRQSTYDKILKIQNDETISIDEKNKKIYEFALGEEKAKELLNLDLPVENNIFLTYCIMGAITGQDPKELQDMAKKQLSKN